MFTNKKQMTESIKDATKLDFAKILDKSGNIERGILRIAERLEFLSVELDVLNGLLLDVLKKRSRNTEIGKKGSRWTELEDKLLIEQASKLATWKERSSVFPERSAKACERRYALLCKKISSQVSNTES